MRAAITPVSRSSAAIPVMKIQKIAVERNKGPRNANGPTRQGDRMPDGRNPQVTKPENVASTA